MLVDDTRFPLVFVVCERNFTLDSVDEIDRGFARVFARGERFAVIADMRAIESLPTAEVRKRLTNVLNRPDFRERQVRYQVSSANLVDTVLVRAAVGVVMWGWNPPWPVTTPATESEAVRWSIERLREAGVTVDEELVGDRVSETSS